MNRLYKLLAVLFLLFAGVAPSYAQLAATETWGGTSGGSANAQTISIQNLGGVLPTGVPIRFIAGFTNTSALQVNVSTIGLVNVRKPSARGTIALTGGEVVAGEIVTVIYDGTQLNLMAPSPPQSVASAYRNLTIQVTSDIAATLTADEIDLSDTNGNGYRLTSVSVTCTITTSGINGLDTGAEASNTWYSISLAYNPGTNTRGCLLSTSATSGSPPSGYTALWRAGWIRNDGSSNLYRTLQRGARAQYIIGTNPTASILAGSGAAGTYSVTTPTWASVTVGGGPSSASGTYVPTTASVISIMACGGCVAGSNSNVYVAPNSSYGGITSVSKPPFLSTNTQTDSFLIDMVLESGAVFWVSSNSAGGLIVAGWTDNL